MIDVAKLLLEGEGAKSHNGRDERGGDLDCVGRQSDLMCCCAPRLLAHGIARYGHVFGAEALEFDASTQRNEVEADARVASSPRWRCEL